MLYENSALFMLLLTVDKRMLIFEKQGPTKALLFHIGVIHLVPTHKGGRWVKQKRTPCVQGGRGRIRGSTYAKTSLFARVL